MPVHIIACLSTSFLTLESCPENSVKQAFCTNYPIIGSEHWCSNVAGSNSIKVTRTESLSIKKIQKRNSYVKIAEGSIMITDENAVSALVCAFFGEACAIIHCDKMY